MTDVLQYEDLIERPEFQSLPYKVETTRSGQIIMRPHLNIHSAFQRAIERKLEAHMSTPGVALQEYAIQTKDGVKAPDVVWLSVEELAQSRAVRITPKAPQICVEVISKGNTAEEIANKKRLYMNAGATEVWTCDLDGTMTFANEQGVLQESTICPDFPKVIDPTVAT